MATKRDLRYLGVLAALAGVLILAAPASSRAQTHEDVLKALKIDDIPADYVLLVDESVSMQRDDLYQKVRRAMTPLLTALSPNDNVSLITFAGAPNVRFSGPRGETPDEAVGQLPTEAHGKHGTDIGAALKTGLSELERPDATDVGAVVLVTDGRHTPPDSTAFPTTSGPQWAALGRRGRELTANHTVKAYALGLGDDTDANLLKKAFADAVYVSLPSSQLRSFFQRVKDETRIEQARELLADDRDKALRVVWPGSVRNLDLTAGTGTIEIGLQNELAHVPLAVSRLRLEAGGLPIKATGLPRSVELEPGQRQTVPVQLTFSKRGGFRVGKKTVVETGSLTFSGTVTTPWATVLADDFRVPIEPKLAAATTSTRAAGQVGWGLLGLAVLLVIAALILWIAIYRYIDRRPKLRGSLTISGPNIPSRRTTLHGRVVKIGKGKEIDLPANGQVIGVRVRKRGRRRGTNIDLVIRYGSGGQTRLSNGHAKTIGDVNFAYRSI